ncbi:nucleotidyltransferase family protein [Rhodovibrionaceae bacterium A322]
MPAKNKANGAAPVSALTPALTPLAKPTHAMVLAAGRGERMRPISDHLPKPMVEVCGQPMIDRVLDRLTEFGVETIVVNLWHLADKMQAHVEGWQQSPHPEGLVKPQVLFSREESLLDTGGGIKKALPLLGDAPFFACNSDLLWLNGVAPVLDLMAQAWNPEQMDALLLQHPSNSAVGYEGLGDFSMDPMGLLQRRLEFEVAPYVYAGVQLIKPELFEDAPDGAFSMNRLWDKALEAQRLYGQHNEGCWYHVGTPQALTEVEALFAEEVWAPQAIHKVVG